MMAIRPLRSLVHILTDMSKARPSGFVITVITDISETE